METKLLDLAKQPYSSKCIQIGVNKLINKLQGCLSKRLKLNTSLNDPSKDDKAKHISHSKACVAASNLIGKTGFSNIFPNHIL